ncbi:MAG: IPT/TIG domain-containing protein [Acidobacteria bacterium]|nr:IPT/TIG domain-containing protein [Acidobacteriota bacterium]
MKARRPLASRLVVLLVVASLTAGAQLPLLADAIALSAARGPGAGEVTLSWSGGTAPYQVFRAALPAAVLDPPNRIVTTPATTLVDAPPAAASAFYLVVGQGPPEIQSITPAGASFGANITVFGQNFGTDRALVQVRFSYTDVPSGENLTIDQAVFAVAETRIDLAVPMATPNVINQVQVIVNGVFSPPVDYLVGPLPPDPTPGVAGNETAEFIDELDGLLQQFDAKLDPWFVETGLLQPWEVQAFHDDMTEMRSAVAAMRADLMARAAQDLAVTDCILGAPSFQDLLQRVRDARAALHGSPLGSIMCEGRDVRDVVRDIVDVLNVIDEILSTVQTALNVACGLSTIAAIFTLGAASPLAAAICTAAAMVETIIGPILDAIRAASTAMDAIASAAPVDPVSGSLAAAVQHPLWGGEPPVVYVQGSIPVEATLSQDFHNAACSPAGCTRSFEIEIYFIPIEIDITIPHITVDDLPMTCAVDAAGSPAFTDLGSVNDGATCRFTGADAFGPSWDRGLRAVRLQSSCGDETLGPVVRSYRLVSGPRLFSVTPGTAQLRDTIELFGEFMPPNAAGALAKAEAPFGDITQQMSSTAADHYTLRVPDTDNLAGTVGLRVQGRDADQVLPFDVLPPVLTMARIDPGFEGEEVELHGTGFATDPARNAVTLSGQPVSVVRTEPFGLVFRVPAGATTGPLALTAASHLSNPLPFGVRRWGAAPGVALSHPDRNADNPALAAHADGTVGVAWIDRHASGGALRLLFTDAAPADSGFRVPIAIAPTVAGTELLGPPSAPQAPDVAIGPDHAFHVVWVDTAGAVRCASFAKGSSPATSVVAIAPIAGTALRDPAVAVMADGSVHVAATRIPTDGGIENTLLHARSTDGGASFGAPAAFGAPGSGTTSDELHKGEVDLTFAGGRLWRAFTQFASYVDLEHGETLQREVFTQSSTDGVTWTVPQGAGGGRVDVAHSGAATSSRNAPSVSGDAAGAVAAWDASSTTPYDPDGPTEIFATRFIAANAEPYDAAGVGVVTPASAGQPQEVSRAALVHHTPGGSAMTVVASVRRVPGTSPDGLPGVPRLHVRRFPLRDFANPTLFETTPTILGNDTATEDAAPALDVDGSNHYHLAWLQGPEGHRVVRYQTTRAPSWPDTLPDDPPAIASPPRDVIAVNMGESYDDGEPRHHWGVLLVLALGRRYAGLPGTRPPLRGRAGHAVGRGEGRGDRRPGDRAVHGPAAVPVDRGRRHALRGVPAAGAQLLPRWSLPSGAGSDRLHAGGDLLLQPLRAGVHRFDERALPRLHRRRQPALRARHRARPGASRTDHRRLEHPALRVGPARRPPGLSRARAVQLRPGVLLLHDHRLEPRGGDDRPVGRGPRDPAAGLQARRLGDRLPLRGRRLLRSARRRAGDRDLHDERVDGPARRRSDRRRSDLVARRRRNRLHPRGSGGEREPDADDLAPRRPGRDAADRTGAGAGRMEFVLDARVGLEAGAAVADVHRRWSRAGAHRARRLTARYPFRFATPARGSHPPRSAPGEDMP